MSEPEEEAMPLNVNIISHPDSTNTKSSEPEIKPQTHTEHPRLLSSISLEVKDTRLPLRTIGPMRTNSMKREPPKILVNRVPPAGIGN